MENLTGKEHLAKIDNGQIIISEKDSRQVVPTEIIYITMSKPTQVKVYNNWKNLRVILAKDMLGDTRKKKQIDDDEEYVEDYEEAEEKVETQKTDTKKRKATTRTKSET